MAQYGFAKGAQATSSTAAASCSTPAKPGTGFLLRALCILRETAELLHRGLTGHSDAVQHDHRRGYCSMKWVRLASCPLVADRDWVSAHARLGPVHRCGCRRYQANDDQRTNDDAPQGSLLRSQHTVSYSVSPESMRLPILSGHDVVKPDPARRLKAHMNWRGYARCSPRCQTPHQQAVGAQQPARSQRSGLG